MTKRINKQVAFFCLPEELASLLEPIVNRNQAQLVVAKETGGRYRLRKAEFPGDLEAVDPNFYAHVPSTTVASEIVSLTNLVQIWFPSLRDNRLRMGRVAMLITDADGTEDQRKRQEGILREVRSALVKRFRHGVVGKNERTGAQQFYKNILFSERAALAANDGVVLVSLMGDGFITYHVDSRRI